MTYYSGTGTASTIKTQLQTTIPANPAWSLVGSTTFGASAYAADVYKCDHAVSGLSADFYAMVLLNGSNLYLGIAEGYNTATHKPIRPAMKATATPLTLQADGGILAAGTEIDWYEGTSGGLSVAAIQHSVYSSFQFYLTVAKDALIINSRSTSSSYYAVGYVGGYDSDLGADDPLPLFVGMGVPASSSASKAYSTRHPRRGGLSTAYAGNLNGVSNDDFASVLYSPTTGGDYVPLAAPSSVDPNAYDGYRLSNTGAAKIPVLNSYGTTAGVGRVANGWRRGWMKHLRYTPTGSMAQGDTVAIDGAQYVYAGGSAGIWIELDPA